MATSLECRVPLLDEEVVDLALAMPARLKIKGRSLKDILKKSMSGTLPDSIIHRGKRGFGAPMGAWMKGNLLNMTRHFLSAVSIGKRGLLDAREVDRLIGNHVKSAEDNTDRLLAILNLEIWCRIYLDGESPEQVSEEISWQAKV